MVSQVLNYQGPSFRYIQWSHVDKTSGPLLGMESCFMYPWWNTIVPSSWTVVCCLWAGLPKCNMLAHSLQLYELTSVHIHVMETWFDTHCRFVNMVCMTSTHVISRKVNADVAGWLISSYLYLSLIVGWRCAKLSWALFLLGYVPLLGAWLPVGGVV